MTENLNQASATDVAVEAVAAPARKGVALPLIAAVGVLAVGAMVYAASVIGGGSFGGGSQAGAMSLSPDKMAVAQQHCEEHRSGESSCGSKKKSCW